MPYVPELWYFDISAIYPKNFVESNLLWYPHVLYISNICELFPYTRNLWANIRCPGCSPLGEKSLWNRSVRYDEFEAYSFKITVTSPGEWITLRITEATDFENTMQISLCLLALGFIILQGAMLWSVFACMMHACSRTYRFCIFWRC